MAQIVQPQPTWQEALGSGLGSGIQSGVTALLEQKLQSMAQEQQANQRMKALEGLQKSGVLGESFTPEALSALKYAPESLLNTLLKERMKGPANQAYAQAAAEVAGGSPVTEVLKKYPGLQGPQINALTASETAKAKTEQKLREHGEVASREHRNKLSEEVKADEVKLAKLERLENLIEKENVAQGIYGNLPGVFQNDATQQAQGLIADILVPLEGRANTDAKLRAILDSFAKLGDTKEAQLEKIRLAKELSKISRLQKEAENKIIEEKGYSPFNIADLGWEKSRSAREKIFSNISKTSASGEWIPGDDMPASKYKGRKRIAEDGTEEISNGKEWLKVSKARV